MAQRTSLYEEHLALNGKMVTFAGWELPVMYSSIVEEHLATRHKAGLFDISHMGEFRVKGKNAADFLSRIIPTRLNKVEPGKSMYSCFPNEHGGIIDDLFIYMINEEDYMIVVNAANIEKDFSWMRKHIIDGVEIEDISAETGKIDLQGPMSKAILTEIINDSELEALERFHFYFTIFEGTELIISNSGYTGEAGYELYINNASAVALWRRIIEAGSPMGLVPAGLGARDSLRIESCYSLYGHEINDETSPVEGGIGWLISSEKEYTAKDILVKQKKEGAPRQIVCLDMTGRGIPREGYAIEYDGERIGEVTSGVFSPLMKNGIAMALVKSGTVKTGDEVSVIIREKPVAARIVQRPFYSYKG